MTTDTNMISNGNPTDEIAPGWTRAAAEEASAESVIDHHRYADETDRVLASYEDVPTFYPSFDELVALGVDVKAMAAALTEGTVNPADLGQDIATLPVAVVNLALRSNPASN